MSISTESPRATSMCSGNRNSDFVHDTSGAILVDFIARFERLEQEAQTIFSRLKLKGRMLPHTNASVRRPYRECFDASSKRQVERLYGKDIEAFGYEF